MRRCAATRPRPSDPPGGASLPSNKLAVLEEYEAATDPGAKGALLRREGLYSSHIVEWRRARDAGAIAGLPARPRPAGRTPAATELAQVRRRAERAEAELAKARLVIDIQGKPPSSWSGCWPRARTIRGSGGDRDCRWRTSTARRHEGRLRRGGPIESDPLPTLRTVPAETSAASWRWITLLGAWTSPRSYRRSPPCALSQRHPPRRPQWMRQTSLTA